MRLKSLALAAVLSLAGAAAQAATTINFDDLSEGTVVSNQYTALGVVFSPNAFSGAGSSTSGMDWASNTAMDVVSVSGDVGGLGSPSLVSGNLMRSFSGWLSEDGDASFRIDFSLGATSFSLDMAGISAVADSRVFVYDGDTLLTTLAAGNGGQFRFSFAAANITHLAVTPGSFNDWVGVDNLTFTAAVPEPETYALMALGLGLVGAVARRRRS